MMRKHFERKYKLKLRAILTDYFEATKRVKDDKSQKALLIGRIIEEFGSVEEGFKVVNEIRNDIS